MTTFRIDPQPTRVVFGAGCLDEVPAELSALGWSRVAVLCTPGHRELGESMARRLGDRCVIVLDEAVMHVPGEQAERTIEKLRQTQVDGCVAVGGGSAIGLAKVVARAGVAPFLAVPTTYSGSEMTSVWGTTVDGVKRTGRAEQVRPRVVVYDPDLTLGLPVDISVVSGMNAVAHAAEALYAADASPLTDLMAVRGISELVAALPVVAAAPGDRGARAAALTGAWLCGACLGATTMGLHHKVCHILGGTFGLPHAQTHTVVLPQVLAHLLPAAPKAAAALETATGRRDPARALWELSASLGAPTGLRELGLPESALDEVVTQLAGAGPMSPRDLGPDELRTLLRAAYTGVEPAAPR